ncbi:MAG: hypothetical protein HY000_25640 [Planctomycetes bacterium]|nr:hypothetical protein [Planctomycetota bacterium]
MKLTIAGGRVRPHVASIRLGQRLRIQNLDGGVYSINIAPILDTPDNPLIQPGNVFERASFDRSQSIPGLPQHLWVKGGVLAV